MVQVGQLLLSLSILILFHEGGHFIAARMFKTRVEKFYLFFDFLFPLPGLLNFSLFKKKIGDTTYGLGWFPLGGYVQISGMIDESLDTEAMKKPAEPWEFRAKPAWQRLIIMLGGIIVNVILAFVIYSFVLFAWGEDKVPMTSLKDGIAADSLAQNLGFKTGDKIVSVDGIKPEYYSEFYKLLITGKTVVVDRNGENKTINLPINFIDKLAKNEKESFLSIRIPFVVDTLDSKSANTKSGLKKHDRIVGINDSIKINYFDEYHSQAKKFKNQTISLNVLRNNTLVKIDNVKLDSNGVAGIMAVVKYKDLDKLGHIKLVHFSYGFFAAFPAGAQKCVDAVKSQIDQFKLIFTPSTGAYKHVGGFGAMAKIFDTGGWDWEAFWTRTALISMLLAFMNLLPIPALDGGHVLFTLWEMITRRAPSIKFLTYSQYLGMALLLLLMLYANGNDIYKAFSK